MTHPHEQSWLGRLRKKLGSFPEPVLAFDLETTGFKKDEDLIVEVGWTIGDGQPMNLGVNWYGSGLVDENWLTERLDHTSSKWSKPEPYRFTPAYVRRGGPPLSTIGTFFAQADEWAQKGGWFLGHNAIGFDLPFLQNHASRFFKRPCPIPAERIVDTGLLEKSMGQNVNLESFPSWPALFANANRLPPARVKWSLHDHCVGKYTLLQFGEVRKEHGAGYDADVTRRLYDTYRRLGAETIQEGASP